MKIQKVCSLIDFIFNSNHFCQKVCLSIKQRFMNPTSRHCSNIWETSVSRILPLSSSVLVRRWSMWWERMHSSVERRAHEVKKYGDQFAGLKKVVKVSFPKKIWVNTRKEAKQSVREEHSGSARTWGEALCVSALALTKWAGRFARHVA